MDHDDNTGGFWQPPVTLTLITFIHCGQALITVTFKSNDPTHLTCLRLTVYKFTVHLSCHSHCDLKQTSYLHYFWQLLHHNDYQTCFFSVPPQGVKDNLPTSKNSDICYTATLILMDNQLNGLIYFFNRRYTVKFLDLIHIYKLTPSEFNCCKSLT